MSDPGSEVNILSTIFILCAIGGGLPLLVLFAIRIFGGNVDIDADIPDGDFDISDVDASADISFKFISFQGFTTFLMMFGLTGYALYHGSNLGPWLSIYGGIIGGLLAVWILAKIYSIFDKLQTSGTVDIKNAVGAEGEVYLRIKEGKTGKVLVSFQDRLREYDAMSDKNEDLETGTRVKVVSISGNKLIVKKVKI